MKEKRKEREEFGAWTLFDMHRTWGKIVQVQVRLIFSKFSKDLTVFCFPFSKQNLIFNQNKLF